MAWASSKPISCSFFGNGKISCGESRGKVEVISLIECVDDVTCHLKSCHLSRVKVTDPQHEGRKTTLHCKKFVNWTMAQEIKDMFNTLVQVGSRK